jgi:hypothetical protein
MKNIFQSDFGKMFSEIQLSMIRVAIFFFEKAELPHPKWHQKELNPRPIRAANLLL